MFKIFLFITTAIVYMFNIVLAQAPAIEWQNTIGGAGEDWLSAIQQTRDGGYILGGPSESGISGDKTEASLGATDYWVVKLQPDAQLTVEEETGASIPSKYSLLQNYPNPFNPKTKIKFDLPENGMVKLNIYNILGHKISELVNRELTAGQHNYSFEAANLPSGIYVYRLETKNYNQTRKMILMK